MTFIRPVIQLPLESGRKKFGVPTRPVGRGDLHVRQAIFGVGAPEAVLVVVVALVVFGPKGLAEAAKSMGKILRSFTPTIRELAEVSTDLKSTFEQEIGLDEIQRDLRDAVDPNILMKPDTAKSITDKKAEEIDPDIAAKRAESAKLAWGTESPKEPTPATVETVGLPDESRPVQETPQDASELSRITTEDLEAELIRRKASKDIPQVLDE